MSILAPILLKVAKQQIYVESKPFTCKNHNAPSNVTLFRNS